MLKAKNNFFTALSSTLSNDVGVSHGVSFIEKMKVANERDKERLGKLNLVLLNRILRPLFVFFVTLSVLDVASTTIAMTAGPAFHELNFFAAQLFDLNFTGFALAMVVKFSPAIPLAYMTLLDDTNVQRRHQVRMVKIAALIALLVIDGVEGYVVIFNNIPQLLQYSLIALPALL